MLRIFVVFCRIQSMTNSICPLMTAPVMELVRQDLNNLLALSDKEVETLVREAVRQVGGRETSRLKRISRI